jgi:hypothetical protein
MKKVLPLIIIIIIIGGFTYYYYNDSKKETVTLDSTFLTDSRILELSQTPSELVNFMSTVMENPSQVIKTNSLLRKMVYSGDYDESERENLVNMQRMLFDEELLEINPKEFHHIMIEAELERWTEFEFKIIGSDYLSPEYQSEDVAVMKVVFYTNDPERDIYTQYALRRNDQDEWKILGWASVDKFEIVK